MFRQNYRTSGLAFPRGRAPRLNRSHIALKGSRMAPGFGFATVARPGGNHMELQSGTLFTKAGSGTSGTNSTGQYTQSTLSGGDGYSTTANKTTSINGLTIACIYMYLGSVQNFKTLVGYSGSANNGRLQIQYVAGVWNRMFLGGRTNTYSSPVFSPTPTVGQTFFVAVSVGPIGTFWVQRDLFTGISTYTSDTTNKWATPETGLDSTYTIAKQGNGSWSNDMPIWATAYIPDSIMGINDLAVWARDPWSLWYPRQRINTVGVFSPAAADFSRVRILGHTGADY